MTELEARDAIGQGARFGDVFPLLSEADGASLKEWFVRLHPWKPPKPIPPSVGGTLLATVEVAKKPAPFPTARKKAERPTGDSCFKCGGVNIQRTGTCETCFDCGESQGGCG